jgi:hypothetical protein
MGTQHPSANLESILLIQHDLLSAHKLNSTWIDNPRSTTLFLVDGKATERCRESEGEKDVIEYSIT